MLGHKWEPAQGTVLTVRAHPGSGHDGARHPEQHYLIEAQLPAGGVVRALVIDKNEFAHPVGARVGVEVNAKTNEIRFDAATRAVDPSPGVVNIAQQIQNLNGPPGAFNTGPPTAVNISGAEGIAHLFDAVIASQSGGASVHVVGPGGQDIPVAMQDGEVGNLAQALLSGDPAAKQAAMERIRNIKDQAQQQAPGGIGQPGQPTDFDQPGGFGQPGGFIQPDFGQPGGFTQPNIGQPPAPRPVGSFDTGMGQGTRQEQLARLQQLLDKGILTESEFEAQRQQVLGQS